MEKYECVQIEQLIMTFAEDPVRFEALSRSSFLSTDSLRESAERDIEGVELLASMRERIDGLGYLEDSNFTHEPEALMQLQEREDDSLVIQVLFTIPLVKYQKISITS